VGKRGFAFHGEFRTRRCKGLALGLGLWLGKDWVGVHSLGLFSSLGLGSRDSGGWCLAFRHCFMCNLVSFLQVVKVKRW